MSLLIKPKTDPIVFDQTKQLKGGAYKMSTPKEGKPGIIIESHQSKHVSGWPGVSRKSGKKGSKFPKTVQLNDALTLADKIVKAHPVLTSINPADSKPALISWNFNKHEVGDSLFKKLKGVSEICIYAAYDQENMNWEIHFYPKLK